MITIVRQKLSGCLYILLFIMNFSVKRCSTRLPFEPFLGDQPLNSYMENVICRTSTLSSKWAFVYVHQLQINENLTTFSRLNSGFPFRQSYLNCFTAVYHEQILASKLLANLNFQRLKHVEILTLINVQQTSPTLLAQTLTALNWLYIACSRCLPFMLLLPPNAQSNSLKSALSSAQLNSTFPLRAVVTFLKSKHPQTFHLNPVLDGCAQTSGLFEPKTSADFSRLKPTKKCNLNNTQLTVSVNEEHPHCSLIFNKKVVDNNNKSPSVSFAPYFTSESSLLWVLQQKYHFSSRLIHGEQIFGAQYNASQGKWTGIVGQVYSGAAHFGFCGLSVMEGRLQFVDFSSATEIDAYAILTPHPQLQSKQWIAFEPFSASVWTLILFSFIAILIIVNWLEKTNYHHHYRFSKTAETLYRILLKTVRFCEFLKDLSNLSFCFLATAYSSSRGPHFLLPIIAAWLLACLVLANAYSGLFYSLLTLPKTERPVDTTEQMFEYLDTHPQLKVIVSAYTERLFLGASRQQNALYARIGQRINK